MLQSQVNYWTLRENIRTHKENENILWAQTHEMQRHQMESENIQRFSAEEQARHNLVSEDLGFSQLRETTRHNKEQESLGWASNSLAKKTYSETVRANKAREKIQNKTIIETRRHNKVQEKLVPETKRHNKATESLSKQQINLGYSELKEVLRSHKANEALQSRRNVTEQLLGWASNALAKDQLAWEQDKYRSYEYPLNYQDTSTRAYDSKTRRGQAVYQGIESATRSAKNISDAIRSWISIGGD